MGTQGIENLKPFAGPNHHSIHREGRVFRLQCGSDLIEWRQITLEELAGDPNATINWIRETMDKHAKVCKLKENDGPVDEASQSADSSEDRQGQRNPEGGAGVNEPGRGCGCTGGGSV